MNIRRNKKILLSILGICLIPSVSNLVVSCSSGESIPVPEASLEMRNVETDLCFKLKYSDYECTITDYKGNAEELIIPEYLVFNSIKTHPSYGYKCKVVDIKVHDDFYDRSFLSNNKTVKKIVFPKSIKKLPYSVCYKVNNIEEVILPDNLEEIYGYAFFGTKLENIEIPNSVKKIWSGAFCNTLIKEITLPNNCEYYSEKSPNPSFDPGTKIIGGIPLDEF